MKEIKFKILEQFIIFCGGGSYEQQKIGKAKLVEKLGIPNNRLAQIINGRLENVSFFEVVGLADAMGVNLNDLYEYDSKEQVKG